MEMIREKDDYLTEVCKICYFEQPESQFTKFLCDHKFCQECILKDLSIKIKNKQSENFVCLEENCKEPLNYYNKKYFDPSPFH